jgi:hypothetical protein
MRKQRLILYANETNGIVSKLQISLWGLFPDEMIEFYEDMEDLLFRISRKKIDIFAAIILITDNENLWLISRMKSVIDGLRIILILPDQQSQTVSLGHKLCPRYLTYADSDFRDIRAVLEKMLEKQETGSV